MRISQPEQCGLWRNTAVSSNCTSLLWRFEVLYLKHPAVVCVCVSECARAHTRGLRLQRTIFRRQVMVCSNPPEMFFFVICTNTTAVGEKQVYSLQYHIYFEKGKRDGRTFLALKQDGEEKEQKILK